MTLKKKKKKKTLIFLPNIKCYVFLMDIFLFYYLLSLTGEFYIF
jgi:hypothetical protein